MATRLRKYSTPAAIALICVCVLLIAFAVPLDKIATYLMEFVPVVFLFFLLANTMVTLLETFCKGGGPTKIIDDPVMKIVTVAWRSFVATAVVLLLSFLLAVLSFFLRHLQVYIEEFLKRILGLSFSLPEKKEWWS